MMSTINYLKFIYVIFILFLLSISYPFTIDANATIISCENGDCSTTVHQHEASWFMMITCEDGSIWTGGGSGEWGGSC